jgi:probable HAF family extracellular repeat protein
MRAKLLGVATAFALSGVTFPAFAGSFLYTDGVYSTLSIPGVPDPGANSANGINDRGQIVGSVSDPLLNSSTGSNSSTGFVYSGGVATILNIPGATGEAGAFGINNAGQIVGVSIDAATGNKNSFVYSGGVYAPFSVPGHPFGHARCDFGYCIEVFDQDERRPENGEQRPKRLVTYTFQRNASRQATAQ